MAEAGPVEFCAGGIRFPCPKPFKGDEKTFEEFSNKLKSYLSMIETRFRMLMKTAQDMATPIDFENQEKCSSGSDGGSSISNRHTTGGLYQWLRVLETPMQEVETSIPGQGYGSNDNHSQLAVQAG